MKTNSSFCVCIYILSLFILADCSTLVLGQVKSRAGEFPAVKQKVVPAYPSAAITKRIHGVVFIDVRINSSGKVDSAKIVLGHNLLSDVAKQAALKWVFSESDRDHVLRLIFIFHDMKATSPETDYQELYPYLAQIFWYATMDDFGLSDKTKKRKNIYP
jgi:TonB family protein